MEGIGLKEIKECLEQDFGMTEFKENQQEAIEHIVNGDDTVIVLPTGAGKSLCYLLPAQLFRKYDNSMTVVVSPTISLMDDQVEKAKKFGLHAERLHSSMTEEEITKVTSDIKNGLIDILYISPERISSSSLMDLLRDKKIGFLAIDEAHCTSTWGHDFRYEYLFLQTARKNLGNPQTALLTGTAPPYVIDDVVKNMGLKQGYAIIIGEPLRENIKIKVINTVGFDKNDVLLKIINEKLGSKGSIIIYANTIDNEVEPIFKFLSEKGLSVAHYHGNLESDLRRKNQKDFMEGNIEILVATSAFGMGVDKLDIRTIIHYSVPNSIEAYVQQSGRDGRDGKDAESILFYDPNDFRVLNAFVLNSNPWPQIIMNMYNYLYSKAEAVLKFSKKENISYEQLQWFLKDFDGPPWLQKQSDSALGILIDLGLIKKEGDSILFSHKGRLEHLSKEQFTELMLKRNSDFTKFYIVKSLVESPKDHRNIIENYLKGTTTDTIRSKEDFYGIVMQKTLGFIGSYKESKGNIAKILNGDKSSSTHQDYARSLPFLGTDSIGVILETLCLENLASKVEIRNEIYFVLNEEGAKYLEEKGIPIKKPTFHEDIHHYTHRKSVKKVIDQWAVKNKVKEYKSVVMWKNELYPSFLDKSHFMIEGIKYSGRDLLFMHSGNPTPSYDAFKQFIRFFMDYDVPTAPVKKKKKKGSRWKR